MQQVSYDSVQSQATLQWFDECPEGTEKRRDAILVLMICYITSYCAHRDDRKLVKQTVVQGFRKHSFTRRPQTYENYCGQAEFGNH